ncbi:Ribosomal RNA-processing protein 7 A [Chionoecetes opilio]|uniref:Ribosomal RNA-processing protein 7 A n=1 Tax=Chionoecetes opilio TaxID=41210 RepID=A0A8J4YHF2_CHIOP|nr:Ribosomal RNA-processing protein 7 A [Chionoecetes opilio]
MLRVASVLISVALALEPVVVVGLRFREGSAASHQVLWKQHSVRSHSDLKPSDRTLFVINVPPYCSQEAFTHLFSLYGKVRQVFFHKRPSAAAPPTPKHPHFSCVAPVTGFKVAYVVFTHQSAIKKAMAVNPGTVLTLSSEERPVLTGLKKWQQEYNGSFVAVESLAEEVKAVMQDYDLKKEREKAQGQQEPDSEGWVTVASE